MFQAGYARVDITPTEPVPMGGYGNTSARIHNNVLSPLYATCVALSGPDGSTALLFSNDLVATFKHVADPIRRAISEATGVPFQNIVISATHTHSSPDLLNVQEPTIPRYTEALKQNMVACAVAAMADRREATASIAKAYTQNLNFVRHYVLEDGTYKGDNFGTYNTSPYQGHTTLADPEMRLVKFHRRGAETILMVNWQTHPHRTGGPKKYDISADIIGAMRDEVEKETGCRFIYFAAGGGNINPTSRIPEENIARDYLEHGKLLAKHAMSAEGSYEPIVVDRVETATKVLTFPTYRADPALLDAAKRIVDHWYATNDRDSAFRMAESYGINSPYAAKEFLIRAYECPDTQDVPFTVFSFGDLSFTSVPYEMFDTNAKYIRDNAPYKMSVIGTLANEIFAYVPSAYGYIHGCYEADSAQFAPGSGERFAYTFLHMLKELKEH